MSSDHQLVQKLNMIGRLSLLCLAATVSLMALPMEAHAVSFAGAANFSAGNGPLAVTTGDFNGDGITDLAVAHFYGSNNVAVLMGNGNGTFAAEVNYAAGSLAASVTTGDFNGDGKTDLAVANSDSNNVSVLINNGNGTFAAAVNYAVGTMPHGVAAADFNGDGKADLAVANFDSDNISVLINNGDGTFGAAVNYAAVLNTYSVITGDFNGDGKADLAATNQGGNNVSVFMGNGYGTFTVAVNYSAGTGPYSVTTGDFNRDGKADLAVANYSSNNVSVLMGNGDGTFGAAVNYATGTSPHSVSAGDFNGDGNPDLAVVNLGGNNVSVLINNGNGTFAAAVNYTVGTQPYSVTSGDFNGDGKTDLAVANNYSNNVSILLNNMLRITPSQGPNGSLVCTPAMVDPTQGASCTVTPNPGFMIDIVSGCGGSLAGSTYTITGVTNDCTVSATFVPIARRLDISVTGFGTVHSSPGTDLACTSSCGMSYDDGAVVTLSATPGAGQMFTGWSGACGGIGTCQVSMNTAKSVTATFTVIYDWTLSVSISGSGTVHSSPGTDLACTSICETSYNDLAVVTLSATPGPGKVFTGWSGACGGTGTCQVTMNDAKSVIATFGYSAVAAGHNHTLAIKPNGTLWAWGQNNYGQLGDGSTINKYYPVDIEPASTFIAIAATNNHTVAIKSDGTLWAWGSNVSGQLGDGTTIDRHSPVQIAPGSTFIAIAAGASHTLAIKSDGTLWAWGYNGFGRLGDGTEVSKYSPVPIASGSTFIAVSAGEYHSMAIKSDGTLWAWGDNYSNQLGDGTRTQRNSPVPIASGSTFMTVAAGNYHTEAIKSNGTLWAWGRNYYGALGDGTTTTRVSPVQIASGSTFIGVADNDTHTAAIKSDGTLWAWGNNLYGKLGDGTTVERDSPVRIASGSTFAAVAIGSIHTVAIKTDGTIWTWGNNSSGQLGDGTTLDKSTPVQVEIGTIIAVTPSAGAGGSINPNAVQYVNINGTTSFTITPNAGYDIGTVSGCNGTLVGNTYTTGPITASCTVTATFIPITWTLSVAVTGFGTIHTSPDTDIACTANCGMSYGEGTVVTLTATPGMGYLFAGWSGDADCADGVVTMNGPKSCSALFSLDIVGIITTVAGDGTWAYSGDDGPATSASLAGPHGVAVDSTGNIYIADYANFRIRKVDAVGTITTVAGNGIAGYSGDNGPAISARLYDAVGVAVDSSGNIYIADSSNNRIRKVDAVGTITTVAGNGTAGYLGDNGPAISARLYGPSEVDVDLSGNIYIADSGNKRIRKVDTSGIITTVAGNGTSGYSGDNGPATSASLYGVSDVAVDSSGNMYIADSYNYRIRKVDTSGIITTVAGNGARGYSGDNRPATSANLDMPFGVAVDSSGNIFIADWGSNRIRKVDTSGTITTVAGNGTEGYSGDNGPATSARLAWPSSVSVDLSGNIYIADRYNNRIRKVTKSILTCTEQQDGTPCYDNSLCTYGDVCNGGTCMGSSIVCDDNNACTTDVCDPAIGCTNTAVNCDDGNICTIDTCNVVDGQCVHTPVANGTECADSDLCNGAERCQDGVCIAGTPLICDDNNICTSDWCDSRMGCVYIPIIVCNDNNACTADSCNPATGNCVFTSINCDDYNACTSDSCDPATGCVHTTIEGCNAVVIITTVAGNGMAGYSGDDVPATSASLFYPSKGAVDLSGNMYIADSGNNRIRKVDTSGTITTVAGNGIYGYSGDNGPAIYALLNNPHGVAVDLSGNIYISDTYNHCIRKIDIFGIITTVAGNGIGDYSGDNGPATSASLYYPEDVEVDSSGNIYIADYMNHRIRKVDISGTITTVAGNGYVGYSSDNGPATSASLDPTGVAVDSSGNIYIADINSHRIRKVDTSGTISTVAGNGLWGYSGDNGPATFANLNRPGGVALDPLGNIYIADYSNYRVRKVDISGTITTVAGNGIFGYSGDNGPATAASLGDPTGVAVDSSGSIYIADSYNNRIRRVMVSISENPCADASVRCNDNDACTTDSCIPETGACVHTPIICNDNNACTTDNCTAMNGCIYTPINCDDNNVCTDDSCNPATGCVFTNNLLPCSDSNSCTTSDVCFNGVCRPGALMNCDDGNVCTDDSCVSGSCVHVNNTAPCNDDNACTVNDTCAGGVCVAEALKSCDDSNCCTTDFCDPATGACVNTEITGCGTAGTPLTHTTLGIEMGVGSGPMTPCSTGSCFGMEVQPGYMIWTDFGAGTDGGLVTGKAQTCAELSSTWNFFGNDGCFNTAPGGEANMFNTTSCSGLDCVNKTALKVLNFSWNGLTIPTGSLCGVNDYQISGAWSMNYSSMVPVGDPSGMGGVHFSMIVRGTVTTDLCWDAATRCNDNNACTADSCDPATGACVRTAVVCNDNNHCTTDSCNPATGCVYTPISCDDGKKCTNDSCDPAQGCVHTPIVCNDNNPCTNDKCDPATGCYAVPVPVDDLDPCTIDKCDPTTGVITHTPIICNDNNACTNDVCVNGICVFTPAVVCNDNNICTTDSCDPANGSCTYLPLDDGSSCIVGTLTGTCSAGRCDTCPAGSLKHVVIRGGGGNPSGADLQIQTSFTVMNSGCIVTSTDSMVTVTPGTTLQVNFSAGYGPNPTSATWKGDPIATDTNHLIVCSDVAGEVGKLVLDNRGAVGGKDTDSMTINVQ